MLEKQIGWSTAQEILELGVDKEDMTIELSHSKLKDLQHRLAS